MQNEWESEARRWRQEWLLPDGVVYLNHGSFGPTPRPVQRARHDWSERLAGQPMDFFLRQMEDALDEAARRLGEFVGADGKDLAFLENATHGMNVVAANTLLGPGDQVLTTDHEYGAVLRIWRRACRRAGAELVVRRLPVPFESEDDLVEALWNGVTERTRLIVLSHVTSPTAAALPVEAVCRRARERDVPVCIDGPHALAMRPLDLRRLDCDFYVASCHKWLSAPFGTGFLYVARRRQQGLAPLITSWGRSVGGRLPSWKDEFLWAGTRDPSGWLAIPAAIEFLTSCGLETFRRRTHELAQSARRRIAEWTGAEALVADSAEWYGSMAALPLPGPAEAPPRGRRDPLQNTLWERHRIEVPVVHWHGGRFVRVSCHLYNRESEIDLLVHALKESLEQDRQLQGP